MYKKKLNQYIWQDLLIGVLVVLIIFTTEELLLGISKEIFSDVINITIDENLCVDIIITQYTITFLIVSLLSLLSGSGEYIYWVDVLEQKIIKPRHLNFTSMSVYAFVSMFAGTIAFFLGKNCLVLIFCTIDVILLVFLTFRMTSVYFGKERLRQKLYKKIEKETKSYLQQPDVEILHSIEDKLNGIYENASKLAEKKQFGEIFETDFQLLIDISEMIGERGVTNLAKILYRNISKILLIFRDNSDYIFSRLNTKYSPFSNKILKNHTIEMLQSALADYFEKVLSDGNYQISHNFWISGIYRNLNKSYLSLLQQTKTTVVIIDKDYHNYEGEVLLYNDEYKGIKSFELLEIKNKLIHEKLLRFSKLIYKNSEELLFKVVNDHGMPIDIMKEIDILGLICDNENLEAAVKACTSVTDKLYIFGLSRYIDTYHDYEVTTKISRANGDMEYYRNFIMEIKENAYNISKNYKDMVYKAAFIKKSPQIVKALLVSMNNSIVEICEIICEHFSKLERKEEVEYKMLFNKDTYEDLVYNVRIQDTAFLEMLTAICEMYSEEEMLCEIANKIIELFVKENDISKQKREKYNCDEKETLDIRSEWLWNVDRRF